MSVSNADRLRGTKQAVAEETRLAFVRHANDATANVGPNLPVHNARQTVQQKTHKERA